MTVEVDMLAGTRRTSPFLRLGFYGLLLTPLAAREVEAVSASGMDFDAGLQPSVSVAETVPDGLSADDWASIRAAYQSGRQAAHSLAGGNNGVHQQAYLKASNVDPGALALWDRFGLRVAVSGDTAVVTAEGERSNATGVNGDQSDNSMEHAGAAYVFVRNGGTWSQQAYLKASNTETNDSFGTSVAASGDTVVIGAYREDSNATGVNGDQSDNSTTSAGAVYVFVRNGTTWSQQAYLKASNPDLGDAFGISVAASGETIVVGAYGEDSWATGVNGDQSNNSIQHAGAAYVFVRNGTSWSQEAYLKASGCDEFDDFGWSVAISGDTLVVGSAGEDGNATGMNGDHLNENATDSGAAYVFVRNGTSWSQQAYLKASNTDPDDAFGGAVSVSGDTVVVGASGESSDATGVNGDQSDNRTPSAGAAYVFVRSGTSWTQEAYIKASNTEAGDSFGAVAVWGDTLVVAAGGEDSGAPRVNGDQADNGEPQAGAAYVFRRNGASWSQQAYVKASSPEQGDAFGGSVALSGDTMLAGAFGEDSSATGVNGDQSDNGAADAGAAYLFVIDPPDSLPFCSSLPNATGFAAELTRSGEPGSGLVLTSTPVPNTLGQFFFGPSMLVGNPFGDGLLCVGGMTQRLLPFISAGMMMQPANTATFTVNYTAPYATGLVGTQHFQHWFRSGLSTGSGFNTSNGLSVNF